jgi:two-component system response regulator AlgR
MSTPELRVFIADDEAPARARLKELLVDINASVATKVAGEAANGMEVIERLPGSGAQLLLLDIQMPGMGGIELARHLSGLENPPAIVFVTAHDRHAVEAFELNALDYLMKPVRGDRLAAALKKAAAAGPVLRERLERAGAQANAGAREFFSVTERNRIALVPVGDVLFLKAELKYVTLRTKAGEHLIEEPLVAIEREFAGRFVRVHRNCLVARAAIRGFERNHSGSLAAAAGDDEPHWNVVLEGLAERLPVSRRQWPALKSLLPEAKE